MQSVLSAASACRWAVEKLGSLMGHLAGWGFILCAFFITFDVVARRFLGFSSQATTEISGYMLAFGLTWGLAHALSTRSHVRIDLLINKLPAGLRQWLHLLSLLLLGVFAAFLTKGAIELVDESVLFGATDISVLRTPLVIPQGLWAVGIAAFMLLIAAMLLENLLLLIAGQGSVVEANLHQRTYADEAAEALEAVSESEKA